MAAQGRARPASGAFPVRRGQRDVAAIETAVRLAREGHVVTMFPEGTRRTKGLVKRFEARPRSGAARIALEAGVPLVPAAVKGTDKLTRLGRLSVAYGAPVEIDDLRGIDFGEAAHEATERLMARIAELEASLMSVLLAVDGDSFAHRAYHSMPKSVRLNAVVGFTNMATQLWQAERPDAVLVGWDTLEAPTYRHTAYAPYQSGRIFEDSIVEQLAILPDVTRAARLLRREGTRLRGRRLSRGGGARVAGRPSSSRRRTGTRTSSSATGSRSSRRSAA